MFENLVSLVKDYAGDAIINNPAIPNEHNDEAISTTASGIIDVLKTQLQSNGIQGLTSMISSGNIDSGVVDTIKNTVSDNLMQKFGLDNSSAGSIVSSLIPVVMSKFTQQTNDPNNSNFDINGIVGALSGGGTIGSVIGKIFG